MGKLTEAAFAAYLKETKAKLAGVLPLTSEKAINYGYQLVLAQDGRRLTLNIYNGKKGLNLIYTGDSRLQAQAEAAIAGQSASELAEAERQPRLWAGSDESGKGDFFGSLVVAAVVVDQTTAAKLRAAGVKDCKLLTDKKIRELEDVIKANVVDCSVLELKPEFYNLRYEQVASQGGKLNQLLASSHLTALSQVLERQPECQSALIDQFMTSPVLLRTLKQRFPSCAVRQQPKAESDLAVAAASVLARAQFLRTLEQLATAAGIEELPKGGSDRATACARRLARKFGRECLRKYVKLHFANYKRV